MTTTVDTEAMTVGRRADSIRRRQRVLGVLDDAASAGGEITVSAIARRAAVDRTFLYRHRDLLARVHALETQPPTGPAGVSRASLQTDLLTAQERAARLAARVQQLERRLTELLGEQAWHDSGLGAPHDIDQLNQRIITFEQTVVDLRLQLDERDQDLQAARASNRELMTRLNTSKATR